MELTLKIYLVLVLVLIKDHFFIKRMLATWHPYTRASFLCQWLESDIGKRMLSSPQAPPLPKYGRNRIRAGRRTKTQPKRVIRANVCLVRHPCHNYDRPPPVALKGRSGPGRSLDRRFKRITYEKNQNLMNVVFSIGSN